MSQLISCPKNQMKQDATKRTLRRRACVLINCKSGGIVRNQMW